MRPRASTLLVALALTLAIGCSSDPTPDATRATTSATTPSRTDAGVTATAPAVPAGVKDCGTQNDLAGWPTTMVSSPDAYACIVEALAAGTPAQMSAITASDGDSGRTTGDGYDLPSRRIVTWVVRGKGVVEETVDRSEDGEPPVTRTCAAFTEASFGVPVAGTDCR